MYYKKKHTHTKSIFDGLGMELTNEKKIREYVMKIDQPLCWNLRLKENIPVVLVMGDTGSGKSAFCDTFRLSHHQKKCLLYIVAFTCEKSQNKKKNFYKTYQKNIENGILNLKILRLSMDQIIKV